jgi:uncharacterized membrane protein YphA (DoxX/SURF4 family)
MKTLNLYVPTLLRLVLGVIFIRHGYRVYTYLHPDGSLLPSLMHPSLMEILSWGTAVVPMACGALLVGGIYSRGSVAMGGIVVGALAIAMRMRVISLGVETFRDTLVGDPRVLDSEFAILIMAAAVVQAELGAGAFALMGDPDSL